MLLKSFNSCTELKLKLVITAIDAVAHVEIHFDSIKIIEKTLHKTWPRSGASRDCLMFIAEVASNICMYLTDYQRLFPHIVNTKKDQEDSSTPMDVE